jgi:hypothetical protein
MLTRLSLRRDDGIVSKIKKIRSISCERQTAPSVIGDSRHNRVAWAVTLSAYQYVTFSFWHGHCT